MKRLFYPTILFLAFGFFIFGCTTDDDPTPEPTKCRASLVVGTADGTTKIEWNQDGTISKFTLFHGTDSTIENSYVYTSGVLNRINRTIAGTASGYYLTVFASEKLSHFSEYDTADVLVGKTVFTYSSDKVSNAKIFYYCNGQEYPVSLLTYTVVGGNITSINQSIDLANLFSAAFCSAPLPENMMLLQTTNYTFDTNKNPAKGILIPSDFLFTMFFGSNNILSSSISGGATITNTYTYNSNGYPKKITDSNGIVTDITYENCN